MRSNWNSHILLVGKQNDTATLENSLAAIYKVKHTLTIHPSTSTSVHSLKRKEKVRPRKDYS